MRLTSATELARPSTDSPAEIAQKTEPSARPSHWRPDIEGLRAVAVGAVIAAHIGFFHSAGGYVGVDVFFVISGFLITSLLLREILKTGRVSITGFYARRAVRLLPAAATVLLATLIATWIWLPRTRLQDIAADAATAALNVINLRLAQTNTDYLNSDVDPSPLQHFWSLAVEEQFYLVWPLILLAIALITTKLYSGKYMRKGLLEKRRKWVIALFLIATAVVSFYLSATQTASEPEWSYFGIHTRAWELAVGALIAVGANRLARVPGALAALASWAGLAIIVASVFLLDDHTVFPGYAAALPVAGTAMVIAAGCVPHRFGAQMLLGIAPAQYIGKVSYGLYLWHWPLIMIGPAALGIEEPRLRHYIMLMGVAFILTVATFYLVEQPVRTRKRLVQVPSRALAVGGALMCVSLAASFVAITQPTQDLDAGEAEAITGNDTTVWQLLNDSSDVQDVPINLQPSLDEARDDKPFSYAEGCMTMEGGTDLAEDCWFGDPDGDKTLVMYGDSHIAQWFPPLNQLAQASGWKMLVLTKAACSIPEIEENNDDRGGRYTECEEWREKALTEIEDLDPDMVIASNSDDKQVIGDDPDQEWVDGWVETTERLLDVTKDVYVIGDTAWGVGNVPDCLSEHPDDATECVNNLDDAIKFPERREEAMAAVADTGATYVDPIPWICDTEAGKCPVVVGNLLVYRDSNHLSSSFSAELAPQLAASIPLEVPEEKADDSESK
ncbi:acyltransferase family protein [Glycomyces buryatensis]|uniref:Acyltransferase n=1 Tax=Glycomyces buryatensis TaxID=2570927 RepID=A0A4S8PZ51_9ACTN|nr:acyltransferase family protein [Glycomyces buryatensis]THV37023.1 acyltransferase [Glycomyces buryatensis]